jgi:hypothetical protein
MATAGGPDIERNGLVFGYDTGYGVADNSTATRFYPGEPTTNITVGTMTPYTPYNTLVRDGQNFTLTMVPGSAKYLTLHNGTNYNGQTLSYSGYMFKNGIPFNPLSTSTRPNTYQSNAGMSNQYYDPITGYFEFTSYFNVSSIWLFHQPVGAADNDIIQINDLQIEVKNYITPFVNGTRSSTQSLLDLTKTTNIDVSNVSFDSTGQPTFDGTDDYINLGDNFDLNDHFTSGGDFSIEAVIYMRESPSLLGGVFCNQKYQSEPDPAGFGLIISNTNKYGLNLTNSTPTSYQQLALIPFNQGEYHHIIYTFDSSLGKTTAYSNGNQYTSTTNSSHSWAIPTDSTRSLIGRNTQGGWGNYINMDIPITKVYNRALSADEVQQNYNAYKNRFNI